MNKINFEITEEEIQSISQYKLNTNQVKKVLEIVENDIVLWDNIEVSIQDAINQI